jgi:hypothetical protein
MSFVAPKGGAKLVFCVVLQPGLPKLDRLVVQGCCALLKVARLCAREVGHCGYECLSLCARLGDR